MHLLDSCFCKLQQTDRQRKRPEYTFLGFHLPPTTFVYLLYKCAAIYFVAKQKKLQKSKNLVGKWMTKFSNPFKKNSTPSTKIIILHFEEHTFFLNWFCKQRTFLDFWFFQIPCKFWIFRDWVRFTNCIFEIFLFLHFG